MAVGVNILRRNTCIMRLVRCGIPILCVGIMLGCVRRPTAEPRIELTAIQDTIRLQESSFLGSFRERIPYRLMNRTGDLLAVGSCSGVHPPMIEVRQGEKWQGREVVIHPCIGPIVYIEPGATYRDSASFGVCRRIESCYIDVTKGPVTVDARLQWRLYRVKKRLERGSRLTGTDTVSVVSPVFRVVLWK